MNLFAILFWPLQFLILRCCDGPDTSGIAAQAAASERVGMRALDLSEKQYADQSKLQDEFMDLARSNSASDKALKDLQFQTAQEEQQRRSDIFNPLEAGIVDEAQNFDSPDRIANEMGKADSAVVQAYDKASRGAARDQLRLGINPNSGKALMLRQNAALDEAKAAANASTAAGERVKAKGFGMRMDAAGLGRNLVSNQTAAADSAVRAGQSSVSGMQSGVDQGNRNFSSVMSGFGTANNAFGTAGSLYAKQSEIDAANDPMNSLGQAVGFGVRAYQGKACGG